MIIYSDEEGLIKSEGIKYDQDQERIILPKIAVGVFSKELFNDVIQKYKCKDVGYMNTANLRRNVYV